jgi:SAM-dependent methyltransferase
VVTEVDELLPLIERLLAGTSQRDHDLQIAGSIAQGGEDELARDPIEHDSSGNTDDIAGGDIDLEVGVLGAHFGDRVSTGVLDRVRVDALGAHGRELLAPDDLLFGEIGRWKFWRRTSHESRLEVATSAVGPWALDCHGWTVTTPDERAALDARDTAAGRPDFASRRLSFGANAAVYDRFRPAYSPEIAAWLLGDPPPGRHLQVLDLATGTGQLAGVVLAAGHDVIAVEPDPGMLAVAQERLGSERVRAGKAEAIPLEDSSVDVVTVGTAWHWFDPALAHEEIARVLRPGGLLSVAWNLRDDRVPWVAAFDAVVDGQDRVLRETEIRFVAAQPYLQAAEHLEIPYSVPIHPSDLVGLASSFSYVSLRPDADEVLHAVAHLVETHPDLAGREEVALPYVASCFRAVLDA